MSTTYDLRGAMQPCPVCMAQLSAATGPEGKPPKPGDLTVCCYCAAPLMFEAGLKVKTLSIEDIRKLLPLERKRLAIAKLTVLLSMEESLPPRSDA